ncbi:MAG TPA: hypothetical protein DDW50_01050 [Firmicutes bacterium]|nr:hypothetical protein [Bacillota bacterium]
MGLGIGDEVDLKNIIFYANFFSQSLILVLAQLAIFKQLLQLIQILIHISLQKLAHISRGFH